MLDQELINNPPFVQAAGYHHGRFEQVELIVIHTMEAPDKGDTAEKTAKYFQNPGLKASAHYCISPEAKILLEDLQWMEAGDIKENDNIVGVDEFSRRQRGRSFKKAKILTKKKRNVECICIELADGKKIVCSIDHLFLAKAGISIWTWVSADSLLINDKLSVPLTPWNLANGSTNFAWLRGFLDGEGCIHKSSKEISFSQTINNGGVLQEAVRILKEEEIPFRLHNRKPSSPKSKAIACVNISGLQGNMELFGSSCPIRFKDRISEIWEGRFLGSRIYDPAVKIVSIRKIGIKEVVSFETSSRTYISNGIISHNCIDNDSIVQCVFDSDTAWACVNANSNGLQLEHAGYAKQTAEDWDSDYNKAMLENSAQLAAYLCKKYDIPPEKAEFAGADDPTVTKKGFCGHAEVPLHGFHWDPGTSFPWDSYLALVKKFMLEPGQAEGGEDNQVSGVQPPGPNPPSGDSVPGPV